MSRDIRTILEKVGALIPNDHFVGTSGRHLDTYITKDLLLPHTEEVSKICAEFAERNKDADIDIVVGPALGGIILSQWTAHHLTQLTGREVLSFYTEKTADNGQVFTRGYGERIKGKRVLVVEDTVTTGGSAVKVAGSVVTAGGTLHGVWVITNRDPEKVNSATLGVPFNALLDLALPSWTPEECPLCKSGKPVNTKYGHGKKFVESSTNA